jgi:hypothetical protein
MKMANNTIDIALLGLNSGALSENRGAKDPGDCPSKSPFEKSLEAALQTVLTVDETEACVTEQFLPSLWQELPPDGSSHISLDGVAEVRALTNAISNKFLETSEMHIESLVPRSALREPTAMFETFAQVTFADGKAAEYSNSVSKMQMQPFSDAIVSITQDNKTAVPDALLAAVSFKIKENHQRLPVENFNGMSLVAQVDGKPQPQVHLQPPQTSQAPTISRSMELVSSTELATHLRVLKSSGGGEARFQLHPAELGRMMVSLTTEGNDTRVAFIVENSQAKQAIETALPRLRDLMDGAGLNLANTDVLQRDPDENRSQPDDHIGEDGHRSSLDSEEIFEPNTVVSTTHLIDIFA